MSFGRLWRWSLALIMTAGLLWAFLVDRRETAEKQALVAKTGFPTYPDYEQAKAAGISDPAAWQFTKAQLAKETDERREREIDAKLKREEEDIQRNMDPGVRMFVKTLAWQKSGFGTVGLVTLTIENMNDFAVKDTVISCDFTANSGTKLGTARNTIYETIKAKNRRTFKDFNIGFIHSQASRGSCAVESAKRL